MKTDFLAKRKDRIARDRAYPSLVPKDEPTPEAASGPKNP
jgi:hypothetical protein